MTAAVKTAPSNHATEVAWRGFGWRGYGPGVAFGFATGAFAAAAIAGPRYYGYGPSYIYGAPYASPYLYARPVYAMPYAYAPVYSAPIYPGYYAEPYGYYPGYRYGRCFTDEGYGRRRSCSAN
jgi:hypothetical protein